MRLIRQFGFHSFLTLSLLLLVGVGSDLSAQGKGRGGGGGGNRGGGGGGQPQRQMPQLQRPQFERRQMQAQRPQVQRQQMPQMQRPQMQRPQFERRQMQAQRPQVQREQMPQMQRQQRERPQFQRQQMPQMDRRAGREQPQFQRQDRGHQARIDRARTDVQRPSVLRSQPRGGGRDNSAFSDRNAGNQQAGPQFRNERGRGRQRDSQNSLPGITGPGVRDRGGWRQRGGDNVAALPGITDGRTRGGGRWERGNQDGGQVDIARSFDRGGRWSRGDVDLSGVNIAPFRERAQQLRQQARAEGWNFNERDFRRNVWEFNQREAWRDDILRSAISVNLGWANDYYYIPPPAYPAYYGVNYEPWYYNIGYTYYDPWASSFYVQPYSYAYRPFDYYYSSYYYDDPYYIDDPYDDFMTVRIFASSGGGFVSRFVGGLLAYGYEQGYRDGLLARQAGYYDYSYYEDPYVYYEDPYYEEDVSVTYTAYEPYSYSVYENRRCLSEGYGLGYRDGLYGNGGYDPYEAAAHIDLVSVYVGATWQVV